MSRPGVSINRGFLLFCIYQLLLGWARCGGHAKRTECNTEKIKYEMYKSCQYKREANLRGEKLLHRTHRIDEYDVQKDNTEEVDETEILESIKSHIPPQPVAERRRYIPTHENFVRGFRDEIPNGPYRSSIIFPGYQVRGGNPPVIPPAVIQPPVISSPVIPPQSGHDHHVESHHWFEDQKRIMRNSYANLIVRCCDSQCNFNDFTQYICP